GYSGRTTELFRTASSEIMGGPVAGKNYAAWSHLAIARHWQLPSFWVFSIGWWTTDKGDPVQYLIEIADGQPEPSALTADIGLVVYRLHRINQTTDPSRLSGVISGTVAIQVNEDGTLMVEPVPDAQDTSTFRGFTSARRLYRR